MGSIARQRQVFILTALLIPVILLVCFVVFPGVDLFRLSATNWDGLAGDYDFIGLDNYIRMFQDGNLWLSLKNNMVYFFIHLLMIPVELAFAVVLNSKLRGAKFYKTMVFMPYIINGVAISIPIPNRYRTDLYRNRRVALHSGFPPVDPPTGS